MAKTEETTETSFTDSQEFHDWTAKAFLPEPCDVESAWKRCQIEEWIEDFSGSDCIPEDKELCEGVMKERERLKSAPDGTDQPNHFCFGHGPESAFLELNEGRLGGDLYDYLLKKNPMFQIVIGGNRPLVWDSVEKVPFPDGCARRLRLVVPWVPTEHRRYAAFTRVLSETHDNAWVSVLLEPISSVRMKPKRST